MASPLSTHIGSEHEQKHTQEKALGWGPYVCSLESIVHFHPSKAPGQRQEYKGTEQGDEAKGPGPRLADATGCNDIARIWAGTRRDI